ncbi:MAG: DUF4386 domain-containing protein [Acidobacteriota bacterium]|nr:DUF4386 domain-containing protein [Acidobacteriota bacterium]
MHLLEPSPSLPRISRYAPALGKLHTHLGGKTKALRNPGRVAGLWYLLLTLLGPVRLIYIPNKLLVLSDPAATVANISAHQTLFRFGIIADLAAAMCW